MQIKRISKKRWLFKSKSTSQSQGWKYNKFAAVLWTYPTKLMRRVCSSVCKSRCNHLRTKTCTATFNKNGIGRRYNHLCQATRAKPFWWPLRFIMHHNEEIRWVRRTRLCPRNSVHSDHVIWRCKVTPTKTNLNLVIEWATLFLKAMPKVPPVTSLVTAHPTFWANIGFQKKKHSHHPPQILLRELRDPRTFILLEWRGHGLYSWRTSVTK